MLAHKHDGGFTRSELGTRRSDLGISGEGRVVEGNIERKCHGCQGVGHLI